MVRKIKSLFETGDLFAWHLHLESKLIAGSCLEQIVGVRANYKTALPDIRDLCRIASSVDRVIKSCPENSVFEMGILYVCARNIAMAASGALAKHPCFGRYSPFAIPGIDFPIDRGMYELMIRSRMAGQRRAAPPDISPDQVLETQQNLLAWSHAIIRAVERSEPRHEQIPAV